LQYANYDRTQPEKRNGSRETDHPSLGTFNTVLYALYLGLDFLMGYALCCWGTWIIWRRWRVERSTVWTLFYGLLVYGVAGIVVWHGFSVTQKLLDTIIFM
jgi:hypothetical protein